MKHLLVLRPQPGAAATAERAATLGFEVTVAPLFTTTALPWDPPSPAGYDALMLTSANAVRLGGQGLATFHAMRVFAVGEATAVAARAAGFAQVEAGSSDAVALLAQMAAAGVRRALHPGGREYRDAGHPAIHIDRIPVYAADPVAELPDAAAAALAGGATAMLHSPRAASLFASFVDDRSRTPIATISAAAADAAGRGWAAIAIAERPDDSALLAAAVRLCDQAG